MKTNMSLKILAAVLLGMAQFTYAQLGLDVEMRPRMEYRDGYKNLITSGQNPALFVSQRTRLGLDYRRSKLQARICFQDVRVWGDETRFSSTGVTGDNASVDLSEAWLRFPLSGRIWLKLGRQIFQYDDQRFLSRRNWNQHGVTYDAILLGYQEQKLQLDLGMSLNNTAERVMGQAYPEEKIKTLSFLFLQHELTSTLKANLLLMGVGFTSADTTEIIYMRATYGGGLSYNSSNLRLDLRAYYQNGRNTEGQSVNAYGYSLDALQRWDGLQTAVGIHYLSGHDQWNSDVTYQGKDHLFDIFYGARHRYYGAMDYFSNVPKSTAGGGLVDFYLRGEYHGTAGYSCRIDYHHFALSADVALWSENDQEYRKPDRGLGSELDLSLELPISETLSLQGGYSILFPETTLRQLQGITEALKPLQNWGWLMLSWKEGLLDY